MSSVRYSKRFRANPNIPKDSLDFQLQSRYDHGRETFPERVDSVLQRDTCLAATSWAAPHGQKEVGSVARMNIFRVLRNTKVIQVKIEEAIGHPLRMGKSNSGEESDLTFNLMLSIPIASDSRMQGKDSSVECQANLQRRPHTAGQQWLLTPDIRWQFLPLLAIY